jgi:uncharacterized RDD family membrane protein YckC
MFCSKCGANVADGAAFCAACGTPMPLSAAEGPNTGVPSAPGVISTPIPGYVPPASLAWQAPVVRPAIAYAGFWLRFVAIIIDFIVIYFVRAIIFLPFGIHMGMHGMPGMFHGRQPQDIGDLMPMLGLIIRIALISALIQWLYFSLMESSAWQGTLGKKALGLTVTDLEGRRISFGRATGRYFAKIISTLILCIGYMMAGFTERKQALHDMIAGTLVLRKL